MAPTALKQEGIAGIAVPIATLAIAGIAVAQCAAGDYALALLRDGFAFVSTLHVGGGGFRPAVAGAIAVVFSWLARATRPRRAPRRRAWCRRSEARLRRPVASPTQIQDSPKVAANPIRMSTIAPRLCESVTTRANTPNTRRLGDRQGHRQPLRRQGTAIKRRQSSRPSMAVKLGSLTRSC
jgi:hypothetical protein